MNKCKLKPYVIKGVMMFKVVEPVSKVIEHDVSRWDLLSLAIQRYTIRKSQVTTGKDVRRLEEKYNKFAKP